LKKGGNVIPFSEIQGLADKVREYRGCYCAVNIEHFAYKAGSSVLTYSVILGDESKLREFTTAQSFIIELKTLAGEADIGVGLEEVA